MDTLKPGTEAYRKRSDRWRHTSHKGSVAMSRSQMRNIRACATTTAEAKNLAFQIDELLIRLNIALNTRLEK